MRAWLATISSKSHGSAAIVIRSPSTEKPQPAIGSACASSRSVSKEDCAPTTHKSCHSAIRHPPTRLGSTQPVAPSLPGASRRGLRGQMAAYDSRLWAAFYDESTSESGHRTFTSFPSGPAAPSAPMIASVSPQQTVPPRALAALPQRSGRDPPLGALLSSLVSRTLESLRPMTRVPRSRVWTRLLLRAV
jgi:hypothetical protein